jgi:hypothetical protein
VSTAVGFLLVSACSSVIYRDGSIHDQAPTDAPIPPTPPIPHLPNVIVPSTQLPDWLQRGAPTAAQTSADPVHAETITPPTSRSLPPAVLRHRRYAISFASDTKKSGASAARFESYKSARTTQEYFQLGGRNADWNWDVARKIVRFDDTELQSIAGTVFMK